MLLAEEIPCGIVNVNEASSYWEPQTPAGGASGSLSGVGRSGGTWSIAEMTEVRTLVLNDAMDALVALINDLSAARAAGATEAQLAAAWSFQRKGQFYLDFVEAENSRGFHASGEAARILGDSINATRQGQIALRDSLDGKTVAPAKMTAPPPVPTAQ